VARASGGGAERRTQREKYCAVSARTTAREATPTHLPSLPPLLIVPLARKCVHAFFSLHPSPSLCLPLSSLATMAAAISFHKNSLSKRNKRDQSDPRVLCLSPRTPEEAIALRDARRDARRASRNGEALVVVTREQLVLLLKCANFHSLPSHTYTHTHTQSHTITHNHTQLEVTKPADLTLEVNTPGERKEEVANVDGHIPMLRCAWAGDGSAQDSCRTSLANEVSSGEVLFVGTQSQ
jgi:hypothetical protein